MQDQDFSRSEIGRRVAARRRALGLTQKQLAQRSGLSLPAIWKIELGKSDPAASSIAKLALALRCSTDYIITGKLPTIGTPEMLQALSRVEDVLRGIRGQIEIEKDADR